MRRSADARASWPALALVVLLLAGVLPSPSLGNSWESRLVPLRVVASLPGLSTGAVGAPLNSDWPMYMHDVGRDSANLNDTALSVANAHNLSLLWTDHLHGSIEGSAVVVNGTVYIGTGTGNFSALNVSNGTARWTTYIGRSVGCNATGGIASTAAVQNGHVYIAGGDSNLYSLNATTGAIEWSVLLGNTSHGFYNWGSPLVADGFIYYGTASRCDAPLVPAALLQIDPGSHTVVRVFNTTQGGALGASIWSSPAINLTTNTVYVTTGNSANLSGAPPKFDQDSVIALNAATLAQLGIWTLPRAQRFHDGDFGASPSLVSAGGRDLVVAINKNGFFYALNQSNVGGGPLWVDQLGAGSPNGYNIATASVANGMVYEGAGQTNISGVPTLGSFYAIYPANGSIKWAHPMPDHVFRAAAYANGLLVTEATKEVQVLSAATGRALFKTTCVYPILSDPTIAEGHIFIGCNGFLSAYGIGLSSGATAIPSSGAAPLPVAFTASAHGGTPPYTYSWRFGDGSGSPASSAVHTYLTAGTFHPTVWVNDSGHNFSNQILKVTVTTTPPPNGGGKPGSTLGKYGLAIIGGAIALAILLLLAVVYRRSRRRQASSPPPPWTPPTPPPAAAPPTQTGGSPGRVAPPPPPPPPPR
ncbi:MAG: PQQ-binding-like beta-propeller repeat protein [Thermoplasmata archaeon]|nr:PQQ-binding-like beta-propeller repeat protein [Thermoplasmata archaeon]